MLNKIRHHLERLPPINFKWAKAHQTNMSRREVRLNDSVDKLAKLQHTVGGKWKSKQQPMLYPNQKIQVRMQEDIYDRECRTQARRHMYGTRAEAYISEKFDFSDEVMRLIDWEIIGKSNQKLNTYKRATRSKYVYRWIYTNQRDNCFKQDRPSQCPLCKQEVEDHHHIQICKIREAVHAR